MFSLFNHFQIFSLPPPLLLSLSFLSLSNGLMFCPVLLAAMCSSSQLVFPLIYSSFISGRHTCPGKRGWRGRGSGEAADIISRWRFHHWVQGPSVARGGPDRKGLTWKCAMHTEQCEPHCHLNTCLSSSFSKSWQKCKEFIHFRYIWIWCWWSSSFAN